LRPFLVTSLVVTILGLGRRKIKKQLVQHSLQVEGFGVRLRPVRLDDSAFIVWLRNLDYVKGQVGDSAADVAGQEAWLKNYFKREGDYYFIAETPGGIPLGTHGIYDVRETSAEKGRHVMRPEVMAGIPAACRSFPSPKMWIQTNRSCAGGTDY
jgi:hypothetical protein